MSVAAEPVPPIPPRPRRRWRRGLVVLLVLLGIAGLLYVFRAPILRAGAGFLVVEDAPEPAAAVLVLTGDRLTDRAAELVGQGLTDRVLLVPETPDRLLAAGLVEPRERVLTARMVARGVSAASVTLLPDHAHTDWQRARVLGAWLADHPDGKVLVLCHRFDTRRTRHIFTAVLGAEAAGRLVWLALPDRRYDERDWWRHKEGLLDVFNCGLGLGHVWLYGETGGEPITWDPDQYEQTLK